jgi:hypothetical protein
VITKQEPCLDMSQIGCSDWSTADCTGRLRRGRPTIHPYEFHVALLPEVKTVSDEVEAGSLSMFSGRVATKEPFVVAIPAVLEVMLTPPGTESGSPGVISDQTKLSAADCALI